MKPSMKSKGRGKKAPVGAQKKTVAKEIRMKWDEEIEDGGSSDDGSDEKEVIESDEDQHESADQKRRR